MAIIGDGDLAQALQQGLIDRDDFIFFCSGVSNSKETNEMEYQREFDLLLDQKDRHLVYFSSLAVFDSSSRYIQHKKDMEQAVKKYFKHWTIVRLGNISWGSNPHTIINYLKAHPEAEIQHVYRHIISKEEFLYWMEKIPAWSCELNIPGRMMLVQEIVEEIKQGKL